MDVYFEDGPFAGRRLTQSKIQGQFFLHSKGDQHLYYLRRREFSVIPGDGKLIHTGYVYAYIKEANEHSQHHRSQADDS